MSTIIYRHEFRTRLKSVVTWSLSVTALVFVFFSFFPVFAEQAALMNQMLAKFPKELLLAFGMGSMDYSKVLGFMTFYFLFIQLCLAIQAGNYGFGLVSIEENELTADFLLTKPVSRPQILTGKLLAAVIQFARYRSGLLGCQFYCHLHISGWTHIRYGERCCFCWAALSSFSCFF